VKSPFARFASLALLALLAWIAILGATATAPILQPDKLVILSTTDVHGETSPCG
jgi:hypothetical protein